MPAISISFNRYLCIMLVCIPAITMAAETLPVLTNPQLQWLGQRIYQNECSSRFSCLTSWNEGENFPSLGIGHFIWYHSKQTEPFEETFPQLLAFYRQQGVQLPAWIEALPTDDSPWRSRDQFIADMDGEALTELRHFLGDTQSIQIAFIVQRLQRQLPDIIASNNSQSLLLHSRFYTVANVDPPMGLYALIDYLHFKGTGTNPNERYQGEGWGLSQVLAGMDANSLEAYVASAESVLRRRVENAPPERNEQRWLQGWHNRVRAYLPARN